MMFVCLVIKVFIGFDNNSFPTYIHTIQRVPVKDI
jgi:hypothetical protein